MRRLQKILHPHLRHFPIFLLHNKHKRERGNCAHERILNIPLDYSILL